LAAIWFAYLGGTFIWLLMALGGRDITPGLIISAIGASVLTLGALIRGMRIARSDSPDSAEERD